MKTVILIPARYASSRYPGKPLATLTGASGIARTLIERSWRAATAVTGVERVVVATDNARIADAVAAFGGETAMTDPAAANGTERRAAWLADSGEAPDLIVNLQGDALLTPPHFLAALIATMAARPEVQVATPAVRCGAGLRQRLRADAAAGRVGGTTVAVAADGRALYFSKSLIPHLPEAAWARADAPLFFHVGVYAYRPAALARYRALPPGELERLEGLEQLRFLEHGLPVHVVEVDAGGAELWELNNPEDRAPIEAALAARGID